MELDGQPVTAEALGTLALANYGHFTTMLVEHGRVRGLSLHLERLRHDWRVLFGGELDVEPVRAHVRRYVAAIARPVVVRTTLFDPALTLERPANPGVPSVLVSARSAPELGLPPMSVGSVELVRELPEVKHVGLLGAMYGRRRARQHGFEQALLVDHHGEVTEGTTWSIGLLDGDVLVWPTAPRLSGVTERLLRAVAVRVGMRVEDRPVPRSELGDYDAAVATNAVTGLRPIGGVDGLRFVASSWVEALAAGYEEIVPEPI